MPAYWTSSLLDEIRNIVLSAAAAILTFNASTVLRRSKPNMSPVTPADELAHSIILEALSRLIPGVQIVSEEMKNYPIKQLDDMFVLVDPLDGTKEFLAGRTEYTVNVAVVGRGGPFLAASWLL
jgi:3'(2'), 5'-bisphosphate nucleotidase